MAFSELFAFSCTPTLFTLISLCLTDLLVLLGEDWMKKKNSLVFIVLISAYVGDKFFYNFMLF